MLTVAVIGASRCDAQTEALAEDAGRYLAKIGATLLCGQAEGVPGAASRGAQSAGGTTIGILPGSARSGEAGSFGISIPTGLGEGRNLLLLRACQVVIAIGEDSGILPEIVLSLKMGLPVVGLGVTEFTGGRLIQPLVRLARTPEQVAEIVSEISAANKGDTTHLWKQRLTATGQPANVPRQ